MKNSIPIATVPRVQNTCCKSYSTVACLLIRLLSIGGNAFCIFPIDKDDAARWCCINRKHFSENLIPGEDKMNISAFFIVPDI